MGRKESNQKKKKKKKKKKNIDRVCRKTLMFKLNVQLWQNGIENFRVVK